MTDILTAVQIIDFDSRATDRMSPERGLDREAKELARWLEKIS
ncbi:hypothetical protein [Puniceibacterium sp. IMCC21224]|nr:hypothetical protein [Puniceibacterium sp. IMCC21224]KMK63928.1 hypothetical protein IMCC21224_1778 [Puniceibacterium sp. IMCC21224]